MVDAVGVVQLIVSLVVAIKGAVDTVKQSKQDCQEIAARVSTLDADLSSLDNTAATKHPVVCSALEGLHLALHQALQVVVDCQEERTIFRHTNAEKLSQRLRQANQNITDQMMRVILVASLQSNIVLNTHHSQHGVVQSLPQQLSQEGYLVNSHEQEESAPISSCFKKFSLSELKVATDNFSEENVIGESTSCTVYKGKLRDGSEVAVKSYSKEQHRALRKQCENEEHFAAKLLHKNIVELRGYCSFGERFCQVYEYMPNRSLSAYIHGDRREWKLSWTKRFNIIKGIARGVVYLHDLCGLRIIHLHLRPSNILLDHGFTPKICDFGISEMLPESVDERVAGLLTGTCAFRAPEYVRHNGRFSVKSDVYSYGILLLELITGVMCVQDDIAFNPLTNMVWESWQQKIWGHCIDQRLLIDGVESQIGEMTRCIHIALLCVEDDPELRPTMSDVLRMLTDKDIKLRCPEKPAYTVTSAL